MLGEPWWCCASGRVGAANCKPDQYHAASLILSRFLLCSLTCRWVVQCVRPSITRVFFIFLVLMASVSAGNFTRTSWSRPELGTVRFGSSMAYEGLHDQFTLLSPVYIDNDEKINPFLQPTHSPTFLAPQTSQTPSSSFICTGIREHRVWEATHVWGYDSPKSSSFNPVLSREIVCLVIRQR